MVAGVRFSAAHNLSLAVKSGGNSLEQNYLAPDGLTLDLSAFMNQLPVDPEAMLATVQGGSSAACTSVGCEL